MLYRIRLSGGISYYLENDLSFEMSSFKEIDNIRDVGVICHYFWRIKSIT